MRCHRSFIFGVLLAVWQYATCQSENVPMNSELRPLRNFYHYPPPWTRSPPLYPMANRRCLSKIRKVGSKMISEKIERGRNRIKAPLSNYHAEKDRNREQLLQEILEPNADMSGRRSASIWSPSPAPGGQKVNQGRVISLANILQQLNAIKQMITDLQKTMTARAPASNLPMSPLIQ